MQPFNRIELQTDEEFKSCCASLYEHQWTQLLLGDSFHPGGLSTTLRLGNMLHLTPQHRILDVASGKGTSAIYLAQQFGCKVVGVDYSACLVEQANIAAQEKSLDDQVTFVHGDAEDFPFENAEFDSVICECAFCTFPNKAIAAREFVRVLKPNGTIGLSDITRSGHLPEELEGLLGWITCIADAQPLEQYKKYIEDAGARLLAVEDFGYALKEMLDDVWGKLLGAELLVKLGKLQLPDLDFEKAKGIAKSARNAIQMNKLGYALMTATVHN